MNKVILLCLSLFTIVFSQDFPDSWSQSYCTYDIGVAHAAATYSLGFGIDNYCIYERDNDTIAYDERRFDIFARLGLVKKIEMEIKYSYPTSGIVGIKYQLLENYIDGALKLGFGYMKGTRVGKITDYVFDFYSTFIFSKRFYKNVALYIAPKIIYSIHARDRQEHSDRAAVHIFQYGFCIGVALGKNFVILPETNWLYGDNEGVSYVVNQFGIGVDLKINQ
ncbi:MAG: hypothetical protein JSV97_10715 [candidate division WOR-3 bacterium]|nr:MAG: hypothetical protein JSV97_10715 [candidate division WOR-3 bacterium]